MSAQSGNDAGHQEVQSDGARRIGFIGLGAMGFWMAKNLRAKTPPTTVLSIYDVVPATLEKFAGEYSALGPVVVCSSAAEVVAQSDCIITIVPEGKHVSAVFSTSPGGALASASDISGKLFLECSTIDIPTSASVCSAVEAQGGVFVDAPVSGGPAGAQKGSLTIMMGLAESHPQISLIKQVLGTMGANLFACGGPTLGLTTKLCNNYISGTIAIATAEGFNLAMRLGLDPVMFQRVLGVSSGGSWVNSHCNPVPHVDPTAPSSHDYAPGFKVQLMRKDYSLAVAAAKDVGAQLYLGPTGLDVYSRASEDPRCVDRDSRVVYRFIGGNEDWRSKEAEGEGSGEKHEG